MVTMKTIIMATHCPILSPLLDNSMEEGQSVDERLEGGVRAVLESGGGYLEVSVTQV